MRKVIILKTCEHTGIEEGEVYETIPYGDDKVILDRRINDNYDPSCTEYTYNVRTATQKDIDIFLNNSK